MRTGTLCLCIALMNGQVLAVAPAAELTLSTFLGGFRGETGRDVVVDGDGNIYVTGGTESSDFPVTIGAYDTTINTGGTRLHDVFVAKFSPTGQLIWSTYLGGPNYDRAYAIEVDTDGFVYVAGRAGDGFPTTQGVIQPIFAGDVNPNSLYDLQDGFVAKLSPDGGQLVWATYFGDNDRTFIRDMDIDAQGYVYIALAANSTGQNPHITSGAFQTTHGGGRDGIVAKLSPDGQQVMWASYLGGSGTDLGTPSIRVDDFGEPVVIGFSNSPDMPTTANAYSRTHSGNGDLHIAKFSADGSQLLVGTFLGGSEVEFTETHGLALDVAGNIIVAATTKSPDFPTTLGAFQTVYGGTGGSGSGAQTNYPGDAFVTILTPDGSSIIASTFLGGSLGDGLEGVSVTGDGTIIVTGATYSNDFPITDDAFQLVNMGKGDIFVVHMTADLQDIIYGTFIGGTGEDFARASIADAKGGIYVFGQTTSNNWPTLAAEQTFEAGDIDAVLAVIKSQNTCVVTGGACDDGDPCTEFDVCSGIGICAGTPEAGCINCIVDPDCDDNLSCTDDACILGRCQIVDTCVDDGDQCNGIEFCDPQFNACTSSGDPCPGACDAQLGCPCQTPLVSAAGPRYLKIVPLPADSTTRVRIFVQSVTYPCIGKYVGTPSPIDINHDFIADGSVAALVDNPGNAALLTPLQWGQVVYIGGPDIIPSSATPVVYEVYAVCGYLTSVATTATSVWGDADANGLVSGADILAVVKGFQLEYGPTASWTLVSNDLSGSLLCYPDGFLSAIDIQRVVQAFQGAKYLDELAINSPNCLLPCQ